PLGLQPEPAAEADERVVDVLQLTEFEHLQLGESLGELFALVPCPVRDPGQYVGDPAFDILLALLVPAFAGLRRDLAHLPVADPAQVRAVGDAGHQVAVRLGRGCQRSGSGAPGTSNTVFDSALQASSRHRNVNAS